MDPITIFRANSPKSLVVDTKSDMDYLLDPFVSTLIKEIHSGSPKAAADSYKQVLSKNKNKNINIGVFDTPKKFSWKMWNIENKKNKKTDRECADEMLFKQEAKRIKKLKSSLKI